MKKKLNAEEQMARNRAASRLMGDPLIKEAFEVIQENYLVNWKNTTPEETEKREIAYMLYKVSADALGKLHQWAQAVKVKDIRDTQAGADGGNSSSKT